MDGPTLLSPPAPAIADAAAHAGAGLLQLHRLRGRTRVTRSLARSPLKLLAPDTHSPTAAVYVTTFGGGLVAGDHIHLDLDAGQHTTTFLTTQSATKIYRAPSEVPARQTLAAHVADHALLVAWPDPLIAFARARYEQRQTFDLAPTASLALVDCQTAGRLARQERWAFARYRSQNAIHVAGRPVVNDTLLLDEDDAPLDHPFRTGRFNALATVILVGPLLQPLIETIQATLGAESAGADSSRRDAHPPQRPAFLQTINPIRNGLLVRCAAEDPRALTQHLRRTLDPLTLLLAQDPWSRKW